MVSVSSWSALKMSLRAFLKKKEDSLAKLLPEAGESSSISDANERVVEVIKQSRKRGAYYHYDSTLRLKIAKYASENGNKSAVIKFSADLGRRVSEATVRNFKRVYLSKVKTGENPDDIKELPKATPGRPLLLGEFDDKVFQYIKQLRAAGGIVNCNILIAAAKGIISHEKPSLLKEYGGTLDFGKKWAESFLLRRQFVRRKATKTARKLPPDFAPIKMSFLKRIEEEMKTNDIPLDLLINWDQTGSKLVPVSCWTMAEEGCKQVPVVGKDDKREITVVLAITSSGILLPPQLIYQGKTMGCHPKITFPSKWHVTHSDNHWSTERTMLEYIDSIIIPYVSDTRRKLDLAPDHPALALFDVFAAHRCDTVLEKLKSNHIHQIFVPASCTGELQPLDVGFNKDFKDLMKSSFSRWYSEEVRDALDRGVAIKDLKVDLRASTIKPLHANWLISTITILGEKKDLIKKPYEQIGIVSQH